MKSDVACKANSSCRLIGFNKELSQTTLLNENSITWFLILVGREFHKEIPPFRTQLDILLVDDPDIDIGNGINN